MNITVEWGYEEHSLTLTPRKWARVKSGKALYIRGKGYHYEGEFFWDYWDFGGGLWGELTVSYGNHGDYSATGFVGKLEDANITELIENRAKSLPMSLTEKEPDPSPEERKRQCFQNLLKLKSPMVPDGDQG
jgi:hypothetical protein